jgi:hypothetical protein
MKNIRDLLIMAASVAILLTSADQLTTKYNTNPMDISCLNSSVEGTLIEVTTKDLKAELLKDGFQLTTNVLRENTSTESRIFTANGKSKYTCNTTLDFTLTAVSGNKSAEDTIANLTDGKETYTTTVDTDYSITENDLGTQYWVRALKVTQGQLTN